MLVNLRQVFSNITRGKPRDLGTDHVVTLTLLAVALSQAPLSDLPVLAAPTALPPNTDPQSSASMQLVQGRKYYEAGQFAPAAKVWQQAHQTFVAQGDRLNQAMVLSNLSLAYQQLGQWNQAHSAIAQSLNLLGYPGEKRAGGAGGAGGAKGRNPNPKSVLESLAGPKPTPPTFRKI